MSGNDDVKAALKEANSRVLAVARAHRSLYTSFDVGWIALSAYLWTLTRDWRDATAGRDGEESAISFTADPLQAGPDIVVAVGIVAAELILNALRHAYPGGRGPVRVSLCAEGPDTKLIVEDDGVGGRTDAARPRGVGQRIMAGRADKLSGVLHYEPRQHGTRAILTFPAGEDVRLLPNRPKNVA